jgi:hypothetical protein
MFTTIACILKRLEDLSAHAANASNTYAFSARANLILFMNSSNTMPSKLLELVDETTNEAHKLGLGLSREKPNDIRIHARRPLLEVQPK